MITLDYCAVCDTTKTYFGHAISLDGTQPGRYVAQVQNDIHNIGFAFGNTPQTAYKKAHRNMRLERLQNTKVDLPDYDKALAQAGQRNNLSWFGYHILSNPLFDSHCYEH